jgi:hypothetical protein
VVQTGEGIKLLLENEVEGGGEVLNLLRSGELSR